MFCKGIAKLACCMLVFGSIYAGNGQNSKPNKIVDKSPDPDDTIRIETKLVCFPVSVLDRNGRSITGLGKEDFIVYEDGTEQEISFFESVDQPFTVFLLLDRSGSMSNHLTELARAASAFADQLRPHDTLIAATFADDVDVLLKPTRVGDLKKGIRLRQNRNDRYTMLFDALDHAQRYMGKIRGRKAIVVFSDGFGDGVFSSDKDNLRKASEGESLIYTVQFKTAPTTTPPYISKEEFSKRIQVANKYMSDLPRVTGGRHYEIDLISDLESAFNRVAEDLRRHYSLGYYPKDLGDRKMMRKIKVKVLVPDVSVRARDDYLFEGRVQD